MKTTKNITLRKGLVAAMIGLTLPIFTNAQEGVIWTRIPNASELLIQNDDQLVTRDHQFNSLISEYNVTEIFPAASNSKNPVLKELYQLNCNCDEQDLLKAVSELPQLFVNPEIGPHYELLFHPDDINIMFPTDWALEKINAMSAWDITTGSSDIEIAISDAGYHFTHPDIVGKTTYQSSGIGTSNIAHGTAVAICAAGATNNSVGKSSIGFNSSLQLYGMNYNELLAASNMGAHVVNASWASGCFFSTYGQQIIDEIHSNGTVIVAAAGNGATCSSSHMDLVYPAAFEHVISVTSVGINDNHERIMGDSTSTHQHNAKVDICAPGYDIAMSGGPSWYTYGSGTSFAAPIVSGTIGLMLATNPCLTPDQIEFILKATANTDVLSLNPQYAWGLGAGRLDAYAAVAMAKEFSTLPAQLMLDANCSSSEQVMEVTQLGGVAPYSFEWTNNSSNLPTATYTSAGTEFVTVKDSLGCVFYTTFEVQALSPIEFEANVFHPSCSNSDNGQIMLNFGPYADNYQVTWSDGSNGTELTDLAPGNYSVVITNNSGCAHSETFEIIAPEEIIVSSMLQDSYTGTDGSIDLTVSGGVAPYSFTWNTDAQTEDLLGLSSGTYAVTVLDQNNCMATESFEVANMNSAGLLEMNEKFEIFPNPTDGSVTISNANTSITRFVLIDMNGSQLGSYDWFDNMLEIDLSTFGSGVYLLQGYAGQEIQAVERVVKY